MEESKTRRFNTWCRAHGTAVVTCLVILLLIIGAGYVWHLGSRVRFWDEAHYLSLMRHLKSSMYSFDGKESTAFQPPGYPFTLYILSLISPRMIFLRFANFIFFAIALICTYRILNKNVSSAAAVIGVCMAALYPLFYYSSGTFYPQMLAAALMLSCLCLVDSLRTPKVLGEFFLGCVYGWLVLVVPLYGLYLPCMALYPWIFKRRNKIRALFLLLLGSFMIVGCWTVRNAVTFHAFIPISTNDGVNLLLGNNDNTTPNIGVNADIHIYQRIAMDMSDADKDAYYRTVALHWIYENPGKAVKNYLLKSLNYFGYTNTLAQHSEQTPLRDFILFVTYYPLLLLALLRICFAGKYPLNEMEKFLVVFFVASPFIHAIFFTRLRFRVPFDFLTIMLAASFLSYRFRGSDA